MTETHFAIALTGGIATGKSTVCSLLKLYGYEIIDADKIAHDMLRSCTDEVEQLFGSKYIKEGVVDRKALGELIFGNKEAKRELEALLHPKIREQIYKECEELDKKGVQYFVDIPLYFETDAYKIRPSVLVYAPREIQLERIQKRDNLIYEDALKRVESQMDIEKKRELADFIIDNSKTLAHLQHQLAELLVKLR